jgi:hypothetical protein
MGNLFHLTVPDLLHCSIKELQMPEALTCTFTTRKEAPVKVSIVPSTDPSCSKGAVQLQIEGPVSLETLDSIISWFKLRTTEAAQP